MIYIAGEDLTCGDWVAIHDGNLLYKATPDDDHRQVIGTLPIDLKKDQQIHIPAQLSDTAFAHLHDAWNYSMGTKSVCKINAMRVTKSNSNDI